MEGVWIKVEELEKLRQQAERIKELEAENAQLSQDLAWRNDELNKKDQQFATLRQRIDDAPVVAWMGEYNINDIRDHYTVVMRHKTDFDGMPERVRALVFKEDLQK